jgi:hypothetical protein
MGGTKNMISWEEESKLRMWNETRDKLQGRIPCRKLL